MENEREMGRTRYRVYQILGIIIGLAFVGLGVAAFLGGGGPIVGSIALAGGILAVLASVVNMVRS